MITGMVNSYIGHIGSKKAYLKRKKALNKQINAVKKRRLLCKPFGRKYYKMIIDKGNDDLYVLRIMYNYYRIKNKCK